MIITRTDIKNSFAQIITTEAVGEGKPLVNCYPYIGADFSGQSPIACLKSGGTKRERGSLGSTRQDAQIRIEVWLYVRDADADSGWTDQMADEALDAAESAIGNSILTHARNDIWFSVSYESISEIEHILYGGIPYLLERISLIFEIKGR